MTRLNKYWALTIIFLVVVIVIGGTVFWSGYSDSKPIEITLSSEPEWQGTVYIGGMVNNPGFYPVKAGDSLQSVIQAAGSTINTADLSGLKIYVPQIGEKTQPQKVDINRAEAWLLEVLPGIGEVKAQAIIDYRCQNGPFNNTAELTKVKGISDATYEQIKLLITVAD